MRRFCLRLAGDDDVLRTRDGREVLAWRVVKDPATSTWPVEVDVVGPNGKDVLTYLVNQNGRKHANVTCDDDIILVDDAKLDCMPDVIKAIRCTQRGDMPGVRSANKMEKISPEPLIIRMEIGCNSD